MIKKSVTNYKVYFLLSPKGVVFYVGMTKRGLSARLQQHIYEARGNSCASERHRNRIRRYKFKIIIVEAAAGLTKKEALKLEREYITSFILSGTSLTNLVCAGKRRWRVGESKLVNDFHI